MIVRIAALLTVFQLILVPGDISTKNQDRKAGFRDVASEIENLAYRISETHTLIINMESKIEGMHHEYTTQQADCKNHYDSLKQECLMAQQRKGNDSSNGNDTDLTQQNQTLPGNCVEVLEIYKKSGVYNIQIPNSDLKPFFVYCEYVGDEKWMIIQRRKDGSINFTRTWSEYQRGFGNWNGEFFIGLDKLHELTQTTLHELWIQLEDFENEQAFAKYNGFAIGSEADDYAIQVLGDYSGNAGDSLMKHVDRKFSTKNMDMSDVNHRNCSVVYAGGWWLNNCYKNLTAYSSLNGQYIRGLYEEANFAQGVIWSSFRGPLYALRYVHMAIRPIYS